MMFAKIRRWTKWLTARYPEDHGATAIRRELGSAAVNVHRTNHVTIAVQSLENRFYFGLFGAILQRLREATGAAGELVVVRSVCGAIGDGWQQRLARSTLVGLIISTQWVRLFRGIVSGVAYRSSSLSHPIRDTLDWIRSRAIWRRARSAADICSLEILGVQVGDLIVDSYLRFRPSPRFESADPFVRRLIWQAHRDVRRARAYFRSRKPKVYLTSYSTYIEHGIAVRVALQEGVSVRSFGNFQQFGKELALTDWFHTADASHYRRTFETLPRQAERLSEAERQLRVRLDGGVDIATSYMRASAYAAPSGPVPQVSGAVVLFLHDFYDSPHVYHDLIFPDFWTWTCFSIDTLMASGTKFFVKPHPNQISLSMEVMQELAAKYPGLPLLSGGNTNSQLAEAGMICGVTMYGTVSHELAYLGVPSIACARHPHHSFDFCRTALTIEEYRRLLLSPRELPVARDEMRRQSLAFYYMHNLYGDAEQLQLRDRFVSFWKSCNRADETDSALLGHLRSLRELPAFSKFAEQLI